MVAGPGRVSAVDDGAEDGEEDEGEGDGGPVPPVLVVAAGAAVAAGDEVGVLLLAERRQANGVLDAAAAPENPLVVRAVVPLADDVRLGEGDLGREHGGAGPRDVLGSAVGGRALVEAAHDVDARLGEAAELGVGVYAAELGDWGHAAVAGLRAVAF